jgi:hypothetical protein
VAAGERVSGVLLYPGGDYADVDLVLIDQQRAGCDRFRAHLPPP